MKCKRMGILTERGMFLLNLRSLRNQARTMRLIDFFDILSKKFSIGTLIFDTDLVNLISLVN